MTNKTPDETKRLPMGDANANPIGISFKSLVAEDFKTHGCKLFSQGFLALLVHRFGNWRMSIRFRVLRLFMTLVYRFAFKATEMLCGISLPYNIPVGRRVCLEHFGGMVLIARSIGNDVTIRQNTTFGIVSKAQLGWPTLEDGVDVGVGAVVIGDITIGAGSIIAANAVVTKDVPPNCVVGGIPAKLLRKRDK